MLYPKQGASLMGDEVRQGLQGDQREGCREMMSGCHPELKSDTLPVLLKVCAVGVDCLLNLNWSLSLSLALSFLSLFVRVPQQ